MLENGQHAEVTECVKSPIDLNSNKELSPAQEQELDILFENTAQVLVPLLNPALISSSDKTRLYSLYKQANVGNCPLSPNFGGSGGFWGKMNWLSLRGMPSSQAETEYINFYTTLRHKEIEHLIQRNYAGAITQEFKTLHNFEPILHLGHVLIPVNQLPPNVLYEYNSVVKTKYMAAGRGKFAYDEAAIQDPRPISDSHFISIWTDTHFSKLVTHLDPNRAELTPFRELFGLRDKDDADYFIVDLTGVHALPLRKRNKAVLCPCVVLLRRRSSGDVVLVSIAIENLDETRALQNSESLNMPPFPLVLNNLRLVYPGDGVAWEISKLHAPLNAIYICGIGQHTVLHASLASPISLTYESMLSKSTNLHCNSVLNRIIGVHSYVQCGVDSNAFDFKESVVYAEGSPYYPWLVDTSGGGVHSIVQLICDGWGESETGQHPIYDGYMNSRNENIISEMDYEDVLPFRQVTPGELGTGEIQNCFDLNGNLIRERGVAAAGKLIEKLLTYFILNAVQHSVEHFLLEGWQLKDIHGVIRIGVDFENKRTGREAISNCMRNINSIADRSRMYLMSNMVSYPHLSRNFADFFIKEGGYFGNEFSGRLCPKKLTILKGYQEEFVVGLERIFEDKCITKVCPHITLSDLGVSVQS
ncbi:hypothetical protein Fcan01_00599 [Folsomia candida]|uniref:ACB domain-containing protein n=1 Tax=Folsomia candida TaxID=158441 RepID=A0A226EWA8_FOLCA|nr:hypothetical protein Fcan01_00599 [Folsomia candida]